jgi:predicted regulator of Ras-like GTPase activity (Roadblock/LC7/MglB family)
MTPAPAEGHRLRQHLHLLRDVEGVHGSFVFATGGALVDSDLPAIFDTDLLSDVGARVARLYETFFAGGGDLDTCVLRYAEHKLYFRKTNFGTLGVLSAVAVNLPALRMVANLVARRVDPEIAALSMAPVPPVPTTLPSPSSAAAVLPTVPPHDPLPVIPEDGRDASVPTSDRHVRMYRGRLVDW